MSLINLKICVLLSSIIVFGAFSADAASVHSSASVFVFSQNDIAALQATKNNSMALMVGNKSHRLVKKYANGSIVVNKIQNKNKITSLSESNVVEIRLEFE